MLASDTWTVAGQDFWKQMLRRERKGRSTSEAKWTVLEQERAAEARFERRTAQAWTARPEPYPSAQSYPSTAGSIIPADHSWRRPESGLPVNNPSWNDVAGCISPKPAHNQRCATFPATWGHFRKVSEHVVADIATPVPERHSPGGGGATRAQSRKVAEDFGGGASRQPAYCRSSMPKQKKEKKGKRNAHKGCAPSLSLGVFLCAQVCFL